MAKYRMRDGGGVYHTEKKLYIPESEENRYWIEFKEWVAAGNVPDPAPPNRQVDFEAVARPLHELPTADFEILDAGIEGATEAVWIKIRVGRRVAFLRGHAEK